MLKSVFVKKMLKNTVFKAFNIINRFTPKRDDYILLYSGNKGIGFNLEPVRQYLLENGYLNNNQVICGIEDLKYAEMDGCKYVTQLNAIFYYLQSKHVFYTAGQIPIKPSKQQIVIHMNHGITDYKTVGALTKINNGDEFFFSYMIAPSPIYIDIFTREYLCKKKNIKICNEPMTERILHPKNKYDFGNYAKVLLWAPTFRKSDYLGYDDSSIEELIPLFNEESYEYLNDVLEKKNILLLVKLHPSQSVEKYKKTSFSNLKIMSHEDFLNHGYNLYDLMAQVDGLLGDYSSASLQYLLTDKPIAYVIPDFDEYKERRGFVFDNPKEYMPGHLIYTEEDFMHFLEDFSGNVDTFVEERMRVKNIIHYYQDDRSCERLIALSEISK